MGSAQVKHDAIAAVFALLCWPNGHRLLDIVFWDFSLRSFMVRDNYDTYPQGGPFSVSIVTIPFGRRILLCCCNESVHV